MISTVEVIIYRLIQIFVVIGGILLIYIMIEQIYEVHQCKNHFLDINKTNKYYFDERTKYRDVKCYANNDFFKFNFGKNIRCTCYGEYISDVDIKKGKVLFQIEEQNFIMKPIFYNITVNENGKQVEYNII